MMSADDPLNEKVLALFQEHLGYRPDRLDSLHFPGDVREIIADALSKDFGRGTARSIAFHLVDWGGEAAFIVALLLWPDRFSKSELSEGLYKLYAKCPQPSGRGVEAFR